MKISIAAIPTLLLTTGVATAEAPVHWKQDMLLIASDAASAVCGTDYAEAEAELTVHEFPTQGTTRLMVKLSGAAPDTLHSVWIGATSPITGIPATPAVPTSEIDALMEFTPPAEGTPEGSNAFRTNHQGKGHVSLTLDFLLSEGAYPFPQGDVEIRRFPSYSVRVASHCTDGLLHGLVPGVHEPTFDGSL